MTGHYVERRFGWDCHGLPIELKVDRELGPKKREMSVADFRRACRAYATRFIDLMTQEFQRLGILGEWDTAYLTMDFKYQAAIARALGVPVNVPDKPALCSFVMPAIVDRGEVTVAIGTEGTSPVLAQRLRAWLERELHPGLDALARLAGDFRDAVA